MKILLKAFLIIITFQTFAMNEQMYLSTPEFDEKLGQFYADKEMEMLENSQ